MVVAIISMAQQARPKVSGQTEFLRPQLYSSSNVVAKIPCLLNSVFKSWSMPTPLAPSQNAFLAGPNQPFDQQKQKHEHSQTSGQRKLRERSGKRQQENRLDIEDQEHDGVQIVGDVQLHPRVTFSLQAAFVGRVFLHSRLSRREEMCPQPRER